MELTQAEKNRLKDFGGVVITNDKEKYHCEKCWNHFDNKDFVIEKWLCKDCERENITTGEIWYWNLKDKQWKEKHWDIEKPMSWYE